MKFIKRAMKRYGRPWSIVTGRLGSYGAAMKVIGNIKHQECGRWLNNRAEHSHQPFRRREGAMSRFRDIRTLQNSPQFTPLYTIISISTVILITAKSLKRTAQLRWLNGVSWRHEIRISVLVRIGLIAP